MIRLPEEIHSRIAGSARAEPEVEVCGYLAGVGAEVRAMFPMRNLDRSPEHFRFDPQEQFAVLGRAREAGLELIGVYHSHPSTPARMSQEDLSWANDLRFVYLIYSLLTGELKAFRVDEEKRVRELPIEVAGSPARADRGEACG